MGKITDLFEQDNGNGTTGCWFKKQLLNEYYISMYIFMCNAVSIDKKNFKNFLAM